MVWIGGAAALVLVIGAIFAFSGGEEQRTATERLALQLQPGTAPSNDGDWRSC